MEERNVDFALLGIAVGESIGFQICKFTNNQTFDKSLLGIDISTRSLCIDILFLNIVLM